jgi:hypothetical protein
MFCNLFVCPRKQSVKKISYILARCKDTWLYIRKHKQANNKKSKNEKETKFKKKYFFKLEIFTQLKCFEIYFCTLCTPSICLLIG